LACTLAQRQIGFLGRLVDSAAFRRRVFGGKPAKTGLIEALDLPRQADWPKLT